MDASSSRIAGRVLHAETKAAICGGFPPCRWLNWRDQRRSRWPLRATWDSRAGTPNGSMPNQLFDYCTDDQSVDAQVRRSLNNANIYGLSQWVGVCVRRVVELPCVRGRASVKCPVILCGVHLVPVAALISRPPSGIQGAVRGPLRKRADADASCTRCSARVATSVAIMHEKVTVLLYVTRRTIAKPRPAPASRSVASCKPLVNRLKLIARPRGSTSGSVDLSREIAGQMIAPPTPRLIDTRIAVRKLIAMPNTRSIAETPSTVGRAVPAGCPRRACVEIDDVLVDLVD